MKTRYTILIPLLILLWGCKKFVEVDAPKNQLITSSVFNTNETATAAMLNIYQGMMKNSPSTYSVSMYSGLYADELKNYSGNIAAVAMYSNALLATNSPSNEIWSSAYNYIYQANAVYEGCMNSTQLSESAKKQLMAEAQFVRAFWYFNLVNFFGNVPLITSTDYLKNQTAKQDAPSTVYSQIIADLLSAEGNLSEGYLDAAGAVTSERLRPTKYTAAALLARVYLYQKEYDKAIAQSSLVIGNTNTFGLTALNSTFLKNSKEAIWQLAMPMPNYGGINTSEGQGFILANAPSSTGVLGITTVSPQLLNAFEPGDFRKATWVNKITSGGTDYYYPFKYTVRLGTTITEYTMVLRLAEQFLIRAEAKVQTGDLNGAIADLDQIRRRAKLPLIGDINPGIGKDDLLKSIWHEYQTELFTEWGARWMTLKRTGLADQVMNMVSPTKGGTWTSNDLLWPIPQTEIRNNPNLNQNPGYN